ncbi:MAG: EamA family transporter [Prolixibacteraceae bacterium]|nr:EamA family transporter [Prolixibacteraceae bacterium]MBN2773060.1 EamA family transporter [Prolixibacteraceae bacterium]
MTSRQYILYLIPTLIWGSTWYAIKFQLGGTDPLVSVSYRFMLAGIILFLFSIITGKNMKFTLREHFFMFLLGISLFGINYWFVYKAETMLTCGVVAVIFSLIIFFNIVFNAIFLKGKIKSEVILAAILGVGGTFLLFKKEFDNFSLNTGDFVVLFFCLGGLVSASLGNIVSAYSQKKKIPVIQSNAFGMTYGGILMFVIAVILDKPINFNTNSSYLISLLYLAVFGSIFAFSSYLKLLGEIGPDRAIYIALLTPAIAMVISTFFEGYRWNIYAFLGIVLLFSGNFIALRIKKQTT